MPSLCVCCCPDGTTDSQSQVLLVLLLLLFSARCGLRWVELEAGGVCHWGTHGRMQCGQSLNA